MTVLTVSVLKRSDNTDEIAKGSINISCCCLSSLNTVCYCETVDNINKARTGEKPSWEESYFCRQARSKGSVVGFLLERGAPGGKYRWVGHYNVLNVLETGEITNGLAPMAIGIIFR